jgi:YesN/AraC family two-component response regulator
MSECRVVLCDDSHDFVRLLTLLLAIEPGMRVVGQAHNGEQAISVCAELEPDVLVLDVSMPVMDGLTALPQVRRVSPSTNVVMLSGLGTDELIPGLNLVSCVRSSSAICGD